VCFARGLGVDGNPKRHDCSAWWLGPVPREGELAVAGVCGGVSVSWCSMGCLACASFFMRALGCRHTYAP
jgi:hypothetical protein